MRRVVLQMGVTLDGYVAGSRGELDWEPRDNTRANPEHVPTTTRPWKPTVTRTVPKPGRHPPYVRGRRDTAAYSATR